MSSVTEMFPTVSGDVELPKTFINSLRVLFDILDEDKDGFVPVSEIEKRWQGDGISGLPNGVLQSLRKVAPQNGSLDFDLFCSALKLTLKTNKERSRSKEHRQPNKAAVRPNNVHPMRSHQSAPHLRVSSTSGSYETGEEPLKPRVKSQHQRNSVGAPVKPINKDHLKPRVVSPHQRLSSVQVDTSKPSNLEDRLKPRGASPHQRINSVGDPSKPSNEVIEHRLKARVKSPHQQINSVGDTIKHNKVMEDRVKPRVVSPQQRINSGSGPVGRPHETMEDRLKPRVKSPHQRVNSGSASAGIDCTIVEDRIKPTLKSPIPLKINPVAEVQSAPVRDKVSPRSPHTVERVSSPKATSNYAQLSCPPAYTYPHRRATHGDSRTSTGTGSSKSPTTDYEEQALKHSSNYATVRARPVVRSPNPTGITHVERSTPVSSSVVRASRPSLSSTVANPTEKQHQFKTTVVKSPPPYMAHVKPQIQKVVKAQLVYPQSNTNQNRSTSAPPPRERNSPPQKKAGRRKKEEPRRHTLSNGITTDFNALKRMKDLEQERDVLHQGLDLLDKCRSWYKEELLRIKEQQHQLISGKDMNRSSHQDKVVYRTTRIMEINRQMRALMNSTEAFPDHMNLAMPQRPALPDEQSPLVNKLKDQNKKLTQEVSLKSDRITSLEKEKSALIRQLFEGRSRPRSREHSDNATLL
ncbi:uncharacterized protein [Apostichopus japonicus]|uniref:uncharacterized protein n=1 Tax=Stichopus japonicus TaxID=307972 RepID=UPI003AB1BFFF